MAREAAEQSERGIVPPVGAPTAYEEALKAAHVDYQIFVYEGANHAFNNDTSEARYNKPAADQAWSRTVEFLKTALA